MIDLSEIETRKPTLPYVWFTASLILWVVFAATLMLSPGSLDSLWAWVIDQSLVIQGIAWVALLPWMAALAIWQASWDLWIRLLAISGLAWVTLYTFIPNRMDPRDSR